MKYKNMFIIFALFSMFLLLCKEDETQTAETHEIKKKTTTTENTSIKASITKKAPVKYPKTFNSYDSLLNLLLSYEDKIMLDPDNMKITRLLMDAAIDSSAGLFYCVGKGIVNPDHPVAVQKQGMQKAAGYTGERWALYLKAWHTGQSISFGKEISGKIKNCTTLFEKQSNDTLYQLLKIPIESVTITIS